MARVISSVDRSYMAAGSFWVGDCCCVMLVFLPVDRGGRGGRRSAAAHAAGRRFDHPTCLLAFGSCPVVPPCSRAVSRSGFRGRCRRRFRSSPHSRASIGAQIHRAQRGCGCGGRRTGSGRPRTQNSSEQARQLRRGGRVNGGAGQRIPARHRRSTVSGRRRDPFPGAVAVSGPSMIGARAVGRPWVTASAPVARPALEAADPAGGGAPGRRRPRPGSPDSVAHAGEVGGALPGRAACAGRLRPRGRGRHLVVWGRGREAGAHDRVGHDAAALRAKRRQSSCASRSGGSGGRFSRSACWVASIRAG